MARVDLHVHSAYSEQPSEWFLQKLGAKESYTDTEHIYRTAKARGMTFVTVTDHNRIEGALVLKDRHPGEVFTGVETTACFPEDGCKVHVLIFGLTPSEFELIQRVRGDIYELREFIRERNLACSVAHATSAVNDRITPDHLEKLILLFDVFEGINGGRNRMHNDVWTAVLRHLTPDDIDDFRRRHRIEPGSERPWIKGLTGGSDDHAGIFIGQSWTDARAERIGHFLDAMRNLRTVPEGRHNDYRSLAFTLYKVVHDHAKSRNGLHSRSFLNSIAEMVFEKKRLRLGDRIRLAGWKLRRRSREYGVRNSLAGLLGDFNRHGDLPVERRLDLVYDRISDISDDFLRVFLGGIDRDLRFSNVEGLVRDLFASAPGAVVIVPFLGALRHLYKNRRLVNDLRARYVDARVRSRRKVLWFSDTVNDLNGISITLKKIGWLAHETGEQLHIVSSLLPGELTPDLPPCLVNLPYVHSFTLPYYDRYVLKVPSLLKSLRAVHALDPDEIVVSTPGPMGLLGLLVAHHLQVKVTGIYHTDYYLHAKAVSGDEPPARILEEYCTWFYGHTDEIRVSTKGYMDILEERGYDRAKMRLFRRGIDTSVFRPLTSGKAFLRSRFDVRDGVTLLFTGRVSRDKNLEFLSDLYRRLSARTPDLNLVIAGDGSCLKELKSRLRDRPRAVFAGRVAQEQLPELYAAADLFLFPSESDTFGMPVLEAQSCGVPALVSHRGGAKEIIVDGRTGFVLDTGRPEEWERRIRMIVNMMEKSPERYQSLRKAARRHVLRHHGWKTAFRDIVGERPAPEPVSVLDGIIPVPVPRGIAEPVG